ncbi:MAG TPA: hypothetical protein VIL88_17810 [Devosia sp.]|jgi:hypothetical protein|uniref:hypothetical protein n=1 Tax=Devosia sp. TaxID=1871048 RepID=UPI002F95B198
MKTDTAATVVSQVLGNWGFHHESVGNDIEIEIEFAVEGAATTRQRLMVFHSVELYGDDGEPNGHTFSTAATELVHALEVKAASAIAAVIETVGAVPSGAPVPPITLKPKI